MNSEFNDDQIRRAVVQRLEDFRRAGLTHWKQIAPASSNVNNVDSARVTTPASVAISPVVMPAAKTPLVESVAYVPSASKPLFADLTEGPNVPKKKLSVPEPDRLLCAPIQPLDLPLEERISELAALAERVKQCSRCHELASTRTQTVFGVGNPQARILFVGEAPGADEDAQGEPFVGRSGQLLNDIIKACRMRREDIYICNVLRCRPPGNRLPAPDEAANCREFLDAQIAMVNPEYIVCWGACAAQNLLSVTDSIGKLRGRFFSYGRAKVLCTYHPSYLMRNPAAKKDVWEDMKRLFLDMGVDLTTKAKI